MRPAGPTRRTVIHGVILRGPRHPGMSTGTQPARGRMPQGTPGLTCRIVSLHPAACRDPVAPGGGLPAVESAGTSNADPRTSGGRPDPSPAHPAGHACLPSPHSVRNARWRAQRQFPHFDGMEGLRVRHLVMPGGSSRRDTQTGAMRGSGGCGVPTSKTGARYHQPAHRCTGRPGGAPLVRRPHSTGG